MQSAVPESTATICSSSPRPASFAWTVRVLPETVTVGAPTKCGLPAQAAGTASAISASARSAASTNRRVRSPPQGKSVPDEATPAGGPRASGQGTQSVRGKGFTWLLRSKIGHRLRRRFVVGQITQASREVASRAKHVQVRSAAVHKWLKNAAVPLLTRCLGVPMSVKCHASSRVIRCNTTCDVEMTYFRDLTGANHAKVGWGISPTALPTSQICGELSRALDRRHVRIRWWRHVAAKLRRSVGDTRDDQPHRAGPQRDLPAGAVYFRVARDG